MAHLEDFDSKGFIQKAPRQLGSKDKQRPVKLSTCMHLTNGVPQKT